MHLSTHRLLLAIMVIILGGATGQFKPCDVVTPTSPSKKLPELPSQYELIVEATILQKNYTVETHEFVDIDNNRATSKVTFNGTMFSVVYNFETYESYTLRGGNCTTRDIRGQPFGVFNFTRGPHGGHIGNVHQLFSFGAQFGETLVSDNETVRGIPVTHWTSCLYMEMYNATMTMDYYFTRSDYQTAMGLKQQMPLRATLKGSADNVDRRGKIEPGKYHNFDHIYEFTYFKAGPIRNQDVFQTPPGVFCKGRKNLKKRPVLPDRFAFSAEAVYDGLQPSNRKIFYDYTAQFTRMDRTPDGRPHKRPHPDFGHTPLKVIHDYNTGLQYTISKVWGNCTLAPIPTYSPDASEVDPGHVVMRHGYEWLNFNKMNFTYKGQRMIRDLPCDVWICDQMPLRKHRNGTHHGPNNATVEMYFLRRNETGPEQPPIMIGSWIRNIGQNHTKERFYHLFDFSTYPIELKTFDIASCYDRMALQKHLIFRVPGTYTDLVSNKQHFFHPAVRNTVAAAAKISPIRVSNIYFDQTSSKYVDVWFTILDKPPIKGDPLITKPLLNVTQAYSNLKTVIASGKGLVIQVQYPDSTKSLKVKSDSFMTDKEAFDPRQPLPVCHIVDGYSNGAVAGVAIALLAVGIVLGLGAAFVIYKRGTTPVPYQVQE